MKGVLTAKELATILGIDPRQLRMAFKSFPDAYRDSRGRYFYPLVNGKVRYQVPRNNRKPKWVDNPILEVLPRDEHVEVAYEEIDRVIKKKLEKVSEMIEKAFEALGELDV